MQETRNNCFGSKKRSTTLLQAKTGKHEYVTATSVANLDFTMSLQADQNVPTLDIKVPTFSVD